MNSIESKFLQHKFGFIDEYGDLFLDIPRILEDVIENKIKNFVVIKQQQNNNVNYEFIYKNSDGHRIAMKTTFENGINPIISIQFQRGFFTPEIPFQKVNWFNVSSDTELNINIMRDRIRTFGGDEFWIYSEVLRPAPKEIFVRETLDVIKAAGGIRFSTLARKPIKGAGSRGGSTVLKTVMFPKSKFNVTQARKWLKKHDMKSDGKVDRTANFLEFKLRRTRPKLGSKKLRGHRIITLSKSDGILGRIMVFGE